MSEQKVINECFRKMSDYNNDEDQKRNKATYRRMKRAFLKSFIRKIDLDGLNPVKITTNELPVDKL